MNTYASFGRRGRTEAPVYRAILATLANLPPDTADELHARFSYIVNQWYFDDPAVRKWSKFDVGHPGNTGEPGENVWTDLFENGFMTKTQFLLLSFS